MEVQTPATIYVASSEQLEGLILKAVRTIIPELAGYQKPAEEASAWLTRAAVDNPIFTYT